MTIPAEGGTILISPDLLRNLAGQFGKASRDMADLETSLNMDANNLISEMFNVLSQSPDALQNFFSRWRISLLDLSDVYLTFNYNLSAIADGAQTWDNNTATTFDEYTHDGHHYY